MGHEETPALQKTNTGGAFAYRVKGTGGIGKVISNIERYLVFAGASEAARRLSKKSSARGLRVRFFSVTTAIGLRVSGNWTGNFLRKGYLSRATAKAGSMVRNCPVASKLLRKLSEVEVTIARGRPSPLAPNASVIRALAKLSYGGNVQRSLTRSTSLMLRRRVHRFCELAATTKESSKSVSTTIFSSAAFSAIRAMTSSTFRVANSSKIGGPAPVATLNAIRGYFRENLSIIAKTRLLAIEL